MTYPKLLEIRQANATVNDQGAFLRSVARPIGVHLAWMAIRLRLRPLFISYLSFLLSVSCCVLFAWGDPSIRWLAILLIPIWEILDVTDGTMARTLKIRSNYGGFIDQLGGIFLIAFLPISIGMGLYRYPEHSVSGVFSSLGLTIEYSPVNTFIFGAYSSVASVFVRLIIKIVQIRFASQVTPEAFTKKGNVFLMFAARQIKSIERFGGLLFPILFLAFVTRKMEWFVLTYFFVYAGILVMLTGYVCVFLRHRHAYIERT